DADADADSNPKELPDTGSNSNNNGGLFGALFAAAGSLILFRNRKKDSKEK
ncbi:LPXTG cell wall anchor domain-containing protein, partial [Staphylococcus pseudintermedius]|nr:LPXTG cell wall anchor domain-containing protein [Staphylococcus pseudintermedius]